MHSLKLSWFAHDNTFFLLKVKLFSVAGQEMLKMKDVCDRSLIAHKHTHTLSGGVIQSGLLNEKGRRRACGLRCRTADLKGSNKSTLPGAGRGLTPEAPQGPAVGPGNSRKYSCSTHSSHYLEIKLLQR